MNVAISLDNCLGQTNETFSVWKERLGWTAQDWRDRGIVGREDFWGAISPYNDVKNAVDRINQLDVHIMVDRPTGLFAITRAWLKKVGIKNAHIHMQAIDRYDCRLNNIDNYINTDLDSLIPFKYERTQAILLNRSLLRYHSMKLDNEILVVPNLNTALEKCNDGKMYVPWGKVL